MIVHKDASAVLEVCSKATGEPWEWKELRENKYMWLQDQEGFEILMAAGTGGGTQFPLRISFNNDIDAEFILLARTALPYWVQRAVELEAEATKLKDEWQYFKESIAPLIECEPNDIQDMSYILNSVQAMQNEERNYSGIADELVESEAENSALRADNAGLAEWIKKLKNSISFCPSYHSCRDEMELACGDRS